MYWFDFSFSCCFLLCGGRCWLSKKPASFDGVLQSPRTDGVERVLISPLFPSLSVQLNVWGEEWQGRLAGAATYVCRTAVVHAKDRYSTGLIDLENLDDSRLFVIF